MIKTGFIFGAMTLLIPSINFAQPGKDKEPAKEHHNKGAETRPAHAGPAGVVS